MGFEQLFAELSVAKPIFQPECMVLARTCLTFLVLWDDVCAFLKTVVSPISLSW
jgi:hypothetical protein